MIQANLADWPQDALESVLRCPLCNSQRREVLHTNLTDRVFRVAAGAWTLQRCLNCDSAYLDPRPTPQSIGAAYAQYYTHKTDDPSRIERYGRLRTLVQRLINGYRNDRYGLAYHPAYSWAKWLIPLCPPVRTALDAQCRHLRRPPANGGSLLDVGCGNGSFLRMASEMGWQAQGIDTDPIAVEAVRSQGLQVQCGEIDLFKDCADKFDVITLSHVIEHVHDPVDLVRQLHRLLKPGGMLWLETPNIESLGHQIYGPDWRDLDPPRHLVLFNPRSLKNLLCDAGFIDIQQHWRGLVVFSIFAASEAIRADSDAMNASPNGIPKIRHILAELFEMLLPSKREFITLVAVKKHQSTI